MTPFAPGQRWTYRTRPGEETSTAFILKREELPHGPVLHIQLDGLHLHNPLTPGRLQTELGHLPITEAAAQACLTGLIEEHVTLPTDLSGYRQWRAAFEAGEAGTFDLPLAEIVETLEQVISANGEATRTQTEHAGLFEKRNLK
ncbi:hypothetical protein ACFFLM_09145 [Deinococcus oregonensis]|uniref:Uncharacterized protein n=1 Tax=Deinococcus oregonensis TaxID=1805970 RepID=A0ABV6B128_9DEIO